MSTPVTTKPSSIASRLWSFGVVHAALAVQSTEAVHELEGREAAAPAAGRTAAGEPTFHALEGGEYERIFGHLASELEAAKDRMISTNSAHLDQLARIVELRERRDGLRDALAGRFLKVRRTFETLYGPGRGFPMLAVSGKTPRTPTGLVAQVRETAAFLEKPRVELPPLEVDGIAVDPPTTAVQLAAGADELDGALVELDEAGKRAEVTRLAKNGAIDAYDRKFLRVARVAESLFHFAGMPELAKRVRPSTRRPGRRLVDDGSQPESGDVPSQQAQTESSGAREADAPVTEIPGTAVAAVAGGRPPRTHHVDQRRGHPLGGAGAPEDLAEHRPQADDDRDVAEGRAHRLPDEAGHLGQRHAAGDRHRQAGEHERHEGVEARAAPGPGEGPPPGLRGARG